MRDYDPMLGRYIQADPLGLVDGASLFTYVLNNPHMLTDKTGTHIDTSGYLDPPRNSQIDGTCDYAALDKKSCKKFMRKLPGHAKALFIACMLLLGEDGSGNPKRPHKERKDNITDPPDEKGYSSQPYDPPKPPKGPPLGGN